MGAIERRGRLEGRRRSGAEGEEGAEEGTGRGDKVEEASRARQSE
jgi:hypothetical protein